MSHRIAAAFVALSFAGLATAQLAGPGLSWSGTSGGYARSFVPSCTTLPVTAVAGETLSLTVWGDLHWPGFLYVSLGSSPCQQFPGVGGGLLLAQPIAMVGLDVLNQPTPCLSCPPGTATFSFLLPGWLPAGITVTFQALAYGGGQPSFTVAIAGTT